MKYQQTTPTGRVAPQVFDVTDTELEVETYIPRLAGLDLIEYRRRVESVLQQHFAKNKYLLNFNPGGGGS